MVATRADGAHRTHRRQQQEREPCGARQRRHGQAARLHDDHGRQVKLGITEVAALSVTTQLPVPGQPPPIQPIKVETGCAAALSVTLVPAANALTQVAPQRIPDGMLAMRPLPVPDRVTVSRSLAVLVKVQVMLRAFPTAVAAMLTVPEVTLLTVANTTLLPASTQLRLLLLLESRFAAPAVSVTVMMVFSLTLTAPVPLLCVS